MNTTAPESTSSATAPTRKYTFWSDELPILGGIDDPALSTSGKYEPGSISSSSASEYLPPLMAGKGLNALLAVLQRPGDETPWLDYEAAAMPTSVEKFMPATTLGFARSAQHKLIHAGAAGSVKKIHSGAIDPGALPAFFLEQDGFPSPAVSELLDIELVLSVVRRAITEVLDSVFKNASLIQHALVGGSEEDVDTTGLAFTDDAAEYPATSRNYSQVKVRISGPEKIKPRNYSDEDHRVWGT
ncbi:hypothetical protein [Mycobacteroides salmoniphilum]|uniref:Uncharacterized protein n=1 Tax=Mycobacteroides salmoniphilum TaxID=404941 RepID=A0A4V3I041_9MYCO|nr:hypothetical protein [Mycobacteroides salmoniphilum]TDZ98340.1 hypothetical protein CCUG60885_00208 [Mycobacteroides salmoniphilum]TEA02870.1 hypothetical protein CCUG60883_03492 [Mycobacteroides salmoniphilum]